MIREKDIFPTYFNWHNDINKKSGDIGERYAKAFDYLYECQERDFETGDIDYDVDRIGNRVIEHCGDQELAHIVKTAVGVQRVTYIEGIYSAKYRSRVPRAFYVEPDFASYLLSCDFPVQGKFIIPPFKWMFFKFGGKFGLQLFSGETSKHVSEIYIWQYDESHIGFLAVGKGPTITDSAIMSDTLFIDNKEVLRSRDEALEKMQDQAYDDDYPDEFKVTFPEDKLHEVVTAQQEIGMFVGRLLSYINCVGADRKTVLTEEYKRRQANPKARKKKNKYFCGKDVIVIGSKFKHRPVYGSQKVKKLSGSQILTYQFSVRGHIHSFWKRVDNMTPDEERTICAEGETKKGNKIGLCRKWVEEYYKGPDAAQVVDKIYEVRK